MLGQNHLTAWLRAMPLWLAALKVHVLQTAFGLYKLLLGGPRTTQATKEATPEAMQEVTHERPQYLEEPLLLSLGGTGFVYKLSDAIVVKKCRPGSEDLLAREQDMFAILSRQTLSPYIIQHFHNTPDAIFMECMPGGSLGTIIGDEQIRDDSTLRVLGVQNLQAAQVCLRWMRQLAAAAAWLEQLNLAHGDIRPANILISGARNVKLADFDHVHTIGEFLPSLTEPFARLLGDEGGEDYGSYGTAGHRTEQFAIGTVAYVLTRGYEPYEDEWWGPEHGPMCQAKFRDMQFPPLGDGPWDQVIEKCWHGGFESIAQLADHVAGMDRDSDSLEVVEQPASASEVASRKQECEMLVQSGVLETLFTR
ncbi:hypothetical protein E4U41_007078 [Claviceps citrina]|nr:hypothetical protein E4U41_007078 [Claviceps citrina]